MPSEEEDALAELDVKKVTLRRRTFTNGKVSSVAPALTALLAKSEELKVTAQAAFTSYVRSVFLHANKAVFDVSKLDVEDYAYSLGLPTVPRLRMVAKLQKQAGRRVSTGGGAAQAAGVPGPGAAGEAPPAVPGRDAGGGTESDYGRDAAASSDADAADAHAERASSCARASTGGPDEGEQLFAMKRKDTFEASHECAPQHESNHSGRTASAVLSNIVHAAPTPRKRPCCILCLTLIRRPRLQR
jgi:Domain of unknown function (DUF4217)